MKRIPLFLVLLTICLAFTRCAKTLNISALSVSEDYCQPNTYSQNSQLNRLSNTDIERLQKQLPHFSLHNLYTANAAGILPLIQKLDSLPISDIASKKTIQYQIILNIQQLNEEIDGLAATLDCEGEKTDQVASYLDNINQKTNSKLTITSILLGAMTTVATVAIQKNSVQNTVAIGGGLLSGGIASLMINPSGKKIKWPQHRNLLGNIWYANNGANMIPMSIWYMLNENIFSNSQKKSLIQSIKTRWLSLNFQEEISPEDERRFFKEGGIFTADDLHLRANMLNELQATVRSLHQDLASLTNNIAQIELTQK